MNVTESSFTMAISIPGTSQSFIPLATYASNPARGSGFPFAGDCEWSAGAPISITHSVRRMTRAEIIRVLENCREIVVANVSPRAEVRTLALGASASRQLNTCITVQV